jgi:hypothetical protein
VANAGVSSVLVREHLTLGGVGRHGSALKMSRGGLGEILDELKSGRKMSRWVEEY